MRLFKLTVLIVGTLAAIFIALSFGSLNTNSSPQIGSEEFAAEISFKPQENSDGSVSVSVLPREIKIGGNLEFEITLDTHSVELDEDLVQVSVLIDESGKEYGPIGWEGDPPGGHHRSGILVFAPITPIPKMLRLIVRNVGGIANREFSWTTGL